MKIRISKKRRLELQECETGSWEDDGCPERGHIYTILGREPFEVLNLRELEEVLGSIENRMQIASASLQFDGLGFGSFRDMGTWLLWLKETRRRLLEAREKNFPNL